MKFLNGAVDQSLIRMFAKSQGISPEDVTQDDIVEHEDEKHRFRLEVAEQHKRDFHKWYKSNAAKFRDLGKLEL